MNKESTNKRINTTYSSNSKITRTDRKGGRRISHIGFAAKDLEEPHHTIAIGKEETVGEIHIEKYIEIKHTCLDISKGDWLGCPFFYPSRSLLLPRNKDYIPLLLQ